MHTKTLDVARLARTLDLTGVPGAFSAAQALYWHCAHYHGGQWSERYAMLGTLEYTPGPMETGCEPDSVEAELYELLASGRIDPADVYAWIQDTLAHQDRG